MGTLTKKLHILKSGGTEETCNIYTTPGEVGGSPYLALEVDGTKGYVKLGSTTDANATHLRVEKNGVTYAAWKEAVTYVNVTITQSANQTIHVYTPRKNGGTDHTSSFKIPKGTAYEAEVIAAGGYTAGTLNVSTGGVINGDMTFSASGATAATVMPGYIEIRPVSGGTKFTVPAGVNVVCLHNNYNSRYIGVTPGSTHTLMFAVNRGDPSFIWKIYCNDHDYKTLFNWTQDMSTSPFVYVDWSSSINDHAVDIKHYDS